ncbi:hypothetical protein B296_00006113 [Ensete ventricosum]|uniref:Uncharacterized protein n=1 Tax=Ensete ventricosum TaxID=4639 RepID=A0A426ZZU1_ENSVE|nr:hypothetical protein B296_00006113 [Ensete ventricosum]
MYCREDSVHEEEYNCRRYLTHHSKNILPESPSHNSSTHPTSPIQIPHPYRVGLQTPAAASEADPTRPQPAPSKRPLVSASAIPGAPSVTCAHPLQNFGTHAAELSRISPTRTRRQEYSFAPNASQPFVSSLSDIRPLAYALCGIPRR